MDANQRLNKELTCVLFPGNVQNEDRAIQCLGGIKTISQICAQPSKKQLPLSFQPENPCINTVNGEAKPAAGVLLKVKVKKTRRNGNIKTEVLDTSVLGHVKKVYKFDTMCDFQYLPLKNTNTSKPECMLEEIIPSGLDNLKFMEEPAPLHIVPGSFLRFDKPMNYFYTDKRSFVAKGDEVGDKDDVHKMRSDRGLPVPRYQFNLTDELPTEPNEYFIEVKNSKMTGNPHLEQEFEAVKKMFDERPVWSYNHFKHHTKIKTASLKIILPCLALYNRNGPWKMLWIKLGYDPRKEPYARNYQTLDFRLRQTVTHDQVVNVRRERGSKKPVADESFSEEIIPEGAVYFKPSTIPPQRQIYYMYCDIQVPEVQEILALEPPTGYLCHHKKGWLPPDTAETCRDIIFKYIKQTVLDNKAADLKFEEAVSSGDELDSDDEDASGIADTSVAEIDDSSINT